MKKKSNPDTTKKTEYHKKCHDCGKFIKRYLWVPKDHRWKKHALCDDCLSCYEDHEPDI